MSSYALERMRTIMRDELISLRNERRSSVINRYRALGEISKSAKTFTTEYVIEKAKIMKKKSLTIGEYRCLQNALLQSEELINAFLSVDNILYSLVRDLTGNNALIQIYAANCCCNIALGNSKACLALAKNAAPYLLSELESVNLPLRDICLWAVGNITGGSYSAFLIFQAQGCMKYLTSLTQSSTRENIPSILYSALHFVSAGLYDINKDELEAFIEVILHKNLSFLDKTHVWLLTYLSCVDTWWHYFHNKFTLAIETLQSELKRGSNNTLLILGLLHLIANTVVEESGHAAEKLLSVEFEEFTKKLLAYDSREVKEAAMWMIGNLFNHPCINIKVAIYQLIPKFPISLRCSPTGAEL